MLQQVFAVEFTTLERRCQSCGDANAAGAHRSYRSAGFVLRCPNCDDVALRLAPQGERLVFELFGTWTGDPGWAPVRAALALRPGSPG